MTRRKARWTAKSPKQAGPILLAALPARRTSSATSCFERFAAIRTLGPRVSNEPSYAVTMISSSGLHAPISATAARKRTGRKWPRWIVITLWSLLGLLAATGLVAFLTVQFGAVHGVELNPHTFARRS